MRPSTLVALVMALVFGGLAAFLARGLIQIPTDEVQVAAAKTVVVASQPLPFGTTLTPDLLQEIPWPANSPLEGVFATKDEILKEGRRATLVAIERNEPILTSKITGPNQRATLSTLLDEGMRAVTVRVDDVRGVAGFILPGDRVDVILTRGENSEQAVADVLLQNIKVLAIDQVASDRQEKPVVARAVTLELNIQQAQQVILAQGVGRLSLALRQPGQATSEFTRPVTLSELGAADPTTPQTQQASERIAQLEAQLAELRRKAEEAEAASREAASRPVPIQPVIAAPVRAATTAVTVIPRRERTVTVNVTRNGTERQQYEVSRERASRVN